MFGNFIYFIVVLLLFSTYQPPDVARLTPLTALISAAGLALFFYTMCRRQMRAIRHRLLLEPVYRLDNRFDQAVRRLSILAVTIFAVDLYVLELPVHVAGLPFFPAAPTASAVVFLGLFIGHMVILWSAACEVHRALHQQEMGKRAYIASNISFALPVMLPWIVLSATVDLIEVLPFEAPRRFLGTSEGEALFFLFFLFCVALFGPLFIQKLWRCRPLESGYWRERITALGRHAGLRFADIVYWPVFGGHMITAGVMGLVSRFRYLLVTEALFEHLTPEEVDAVVAHEIGHVKKRHLMFYLLFFGGYLLFYYSVFEIVLYFLLFTAPVRHVVEVTGASPAAAAGVIVTVTVIVLFLLYFRYIFGFFMRNFERQADTYVYSLFKSAVPLVSTLKKIAYYSGQAADKPNWHHFSIAQRIDYLEKCEADRAWVDRQDGKVRKAIIGYLIALAAVAVVGYQLNFGGMGRRLNSHFVENILVAEMEKGDAAPELVRTLGDLYFERKAYAEAEKAYRRALSINPLDADTLNNLAWLYATAEDPAFNRPEDALSLAEKAVRLEAAPHILDTLAESYFVNNRFEEAYRVSRHALNLATENRPYFERQLEKFQKAWRIHGDAERLDV